MGLRTYSTPFPAPYSGVNRKTYYNQSSNSPKVGGKLVLISNAHNFQESTVTAWRPLGPLAYALGASNVNNYPLDGPQYNEVYAKWVGKLRRGDASLGVTLASWGQSRSMIIDRAKKLGKFFDKRSKVVKQKPWLNRRRDRASDFLEGEFGWLPLVSDIHAVLTTVCQDAIPPQWCRATKRYHDSWTVEQYSGGKLANRRVYTANGRLTIGAKAEISNPNLWLANRLGLINPLTVAWDLVPWSFVVNMFVNVNQVVSSLTDTVGLNITGGNVTRSSHVLVEDAGFILNDFTSGGITYPKGASFTSNVVTKCRNRQLGIATPSIELKLPKVNFELAAIATALLTQKVSKV